jgi:hypothetical protein
LHQKDIHPGLDLRVGEVVEVRSKEEVLATLDSKGAFEGLPFMPEMLTHCGKRFTVRKRAHKVCDDISGSGLRRMNAVLLDDVRCDGSAHGGCNAGCPMLWKEAWLRRVDPASSFQSSEIALISATHKVVGRANGCTPEMLVAATRATPHEASSGEETFSCQATEMLTASGEVIPAWHPGQYVEDIRSGNVGFFEFVRGFVKSAVMPSRWEWRHPLIHGKLKKGTTPSRLLDLQPGEVVRIKPRKEIVATLDTTNRNRGLSFDKEMLKYCGRLARVRHRVDRIINENTGEMIHFKTDCVVLDDVVCSGNYRRLCPRRNFPYWREIWLERVSDAESQRYLLIESRRLARK